MQMKIPKCDNVVSSDENSIPGIKQTKHKSFPKFCKMTIKSDFFEIILKFSPTN